mmetsp:Transcript_21734/g.49137  ORF Transcript_21734/g.49137 Transcript_21734/m.49137 type:complete len:504 (-) Transcript_21734:33-1544(-)
MSTSEEATMGRFLWGGGLFPVFVVCIWGPLRLHARSKLFRLDLEDRRGLFALLPVPLLLLLPGDGRLREHLGPRLVVLGRLAPDGAVGESLRDLVLVRRDRGRRLETQPGVVGLVLLRVLLGRRLAQVPLVRRLPRQRGAVFRVLGRLGAGPLQRALPLAGLEGELLRLGGLEEALLVHPGVPRRPLPGVRLAEHRPLGLRVGRHLRLRGPVRVRGLERLPARLVGRLAQVEALRARLLVRPPGVVLRARLVRAQAEHRPEGVVVRGGRLGLGADLVPPVRHRRGLVHHRPAVEPLGIGRALALSGVVLRVGPGQLFVRLLPPRALHLRLELRVGLVRGRLGLTRLAREEEGEGVAHGALVARAGGVLLAALLERLVHLPAPRREVVLEDLPVRRPHVLLLPRPLGHLPVPALPGPLVTLENEGLWRRGADGACVSVPARRVVRPGLKLSSRSVQIFRASRAPGLDVSIVHSFWAHDKRLNPIRQVSLLAVFSSLFSVGGEGF